MTYPNQTITVLDPGVGRVTIAADTPVYIGPSFGGTLIENTLYSFSKLNTIRSDIGYGPLPDFVAKALQQRGGPVLVVRCGSAVAQAIGTVNESNPAGPDVTFTGTVRDTYSVTVRITKTGALGVGEFDYSLDHHDPGLGEQFSNQNPTFSPVRTIPAGGVFNAGSSGLIFTFAAGTYTAGDTHKVFCRPAKPNATDLSDSMVALTGAPSVLFPLVTVATDYDSAAEASTMATALSGHLTTFASGRYARGIVDAGCFGVTSASVLTEAANWSSRRINPWFGVTWANTTLPYEGFSLRIGSPVHDTAARAARELVSTDLARFASGALDGVRNIFFDGNDDATLDGAGISALRTWEGIPGFYVGNARLKSPPGSDFTDLHFGRVMDLACQTVQAATLPFVAEGFRTQADGSIDPLDRADVEIAINGALTDKLLRPVNARGRPGHVSAAFATVDPTHNLNTTEELLVSIALRPLGYAKFIHQTIGFALNV